MRSKRLGDGELTVLKALWTLGDAQVKEVRKYLREQGTELAYNTVQTVLGRLVEKRVVSCCKFEAAHRFKAIVDRERFRRDSLDEVVGKLYDGNVGAMAFQLVKQGRLKAGEIEQLQELLLDLARKKRKRPRRSK